MNFQSLPLFGFRPQNRHFSVLGIVAEFFYLDYMLSYAKKSEKNIGEKIIALSIAIFLEFTIESFSFFLYFFVNAVTSHEFFNCETEKTATDRAKVFSPIFFSDFLA